MFIVEGNIGVGKSTFLRALATINSQISVVPEPKDDWTKPVQGESLLDNFYHNPSRWAYTMETLALMRRSSDYVSQPATDAQTIRILERSMYSGHYCFAKNGHDAGYFSPLEWHLYNEWVNFLFARCTKPSGFIYLRAAPEICFGRIQKRNRPAETALTYEYVTQIHAYHEQFLIKRENVHTDIARIPVLVLDCNAEFATAISLSKEHEIALIQFIKTTKNNEKCFDF